MKSKIKRIGTDAAGYGLILLGIASGWLPGPGGIPLVLAGLSLLSINNEWAQRLRDYIIKDGSKFLRKLFPKNATIQAAYDILALSMIGLAVWLAVRHAAIWQLSLAAFLVCIALLISAFNRERFARLKIKMQSSQNNKTSE